MFLTDQLLVVALAFLLGIVDASLGMGYGTILTPMLLIIGFDPLQVIPAILVSQLAGDFLAAAFHHRLKNVNLAFGSKHSKIALLLAALSITGATAAVLIAVSLPTFYLNLYIGVSVAVSGLVVLAATRRNYPFSWIRLLAFGSFAAFNKGISGGGYGPIMIAGQLLSGVEVKGAIGITVVAEGVTSLVAALAFVLVRGSIDLLLLSGLTIGIALSTPIAAFIVKEVDDRKVKTIIGIVTLLLGTLTIMGVLQRWIT
jgi:hypothetical protein